jgi:HSP20 family protein
MSEEETMATQKQNEKPGDGGQRQQAITVQRGQDRPLARERGPLARRIYRTSPLSSMMRRMFDDMDTSTGSPFGGTSPFAMMRRMFDDMDRMLDTDVFGDVDWRARESTWAPRVEITQHGDNLVVRADLPGISQDEVNLSIEDNALVIEGERTMPSEEQQADVWCSECPYGQFRRVVALPEGVDPEKAEARYQQGVLEVSMPFPATGARGRRIEIQTGGKAEPRPNPQLKEGAPQQPQKAEQR